MKQMTSNKDLRSEKNYVYDVQTDMICNGFEKYLAAAFILLEKIIDIRLAEQDVSDTQDERWVVR